MSAVPVTRPATERRPWRAVAIPAEHGGWGLTLEPVLLGLLVAPSVAGLALGVAALLTFLVRTPLKLALVDRRRGRWLDRSALALRIAVVELTLIAALAVLALVLAGPVWLIPVALAAPFVGVELWFDVRSRGRQLVPELCGATGIAAVVSAIVVAGGGTAALAVALWLLLTARSLLIIPFIRTQIRRMRRGEEPARPVDVMQVCALALAALAVVIERSVLAGALGLAVLALVQAAGARRPVTSIRALGFRQMAYGIGLVLVTAAGVWAA